MRVYVWRVRINEYRFYSEKLEHLVLCAHTHTKIHIFIHTVKQIHKKRMCVRSHKLLHTTVNYINCFE